MHFGRPCTDRSLVARLLIHEDVSEKRIVFKEKSMDYFLFPFHSAHFLSVPLFNFILINMESVLKASRGF